MSGEKLGAGVGGKVVEVNAREGDLVKAGDVLLRLDTERIDNEIARAGALLAAARDEVSRLERLRSLEEERREAELADVAAEERLAELELERAREEETRSRGLVELGAIARVELEQAVSKRREAEERARRGRRARSEKEHASRREELEIRLGAARARLEESSRSLANLELERAGAEIRAHVDGIVTVGDVKVGDRIDAGKPVFAIAQQKGFRMDAAVPTSDIAFVKVGMKARVKLDAFDYQKYGALEGQVYYVSPDSEAEEGKVYFVVRVRVEPGALPVKFGMTGRVEILVGHERVASLLVRRVQEKISG